MPSPPPARLTRGRLLALAVFCGIASSIVYIPQALLTSISDDFGVSPQIASLLTAAALLGYALGILFFIPFGTRVRTTVQVAVQATALAGALVLTAHTRDVTAAVAAFFAVGLLGNLSQVVIPAANRMSAPERRGATNSVLVGALLVGLFGGRALASTATDWVGWRGTILACAALILAVLPTTVWALGRALPPIGSRRGHLTLVASTLRVARGNPVLLRAALTQAMVLGTFNSLWAVMVLHLTAPPISWSVTQAGVFGLVGLVAGVLTPWSGRLVDRFGAWRMTGVFLGVLFAASVATYATHSLPVLFGLAMFFSTWANQSALSGNQVQALSTDPDNSAQLNTAFSFVVFFIGGFGGFVGPAIYGLGGMPAVALEVTALSALALAVWRFGPTARG